MNILKRFLPAVMLPLLLIGSSVCAQTDEDELFSTAQRAFDDGFHDVAIRYLEEFLPKYPQSKKMDAAKLLLGQCYYFRGDFPKAMAIFKSLADITESKDMLLFWTGETYLKLSDYAQAREQYSQLTASFPDSVYIPQAMYSLAWSYFDEKDYAKAGGIFAALVAKFPKHQLSEDAFLKSAECVYNTGDYTAAIKLFEKYLAQYPQSQHAGQVNLNIADAYYYMEDFAHAMPAYEKAGKASQDPKAVQIAYIGKIWCAIKQKMYDQAQKWAKEAMDFSREKNLSQEDLFLAEGNLLYEKGDWDVSASAYTDLIRNFPNGTHRLEAYLGRGNAYYFLKKFNDAQADFRFVLDHRQPDSDPQLAEKADLGLGWTYAKLGNTADAVKSFQSVFDRTKEPETKANALVQIGDAYQDAGNFDAAVDAYASVLKDYPSNAMMDYVIYRQGIAFLKSDKTGAALEAFNRLQHDFSGSKYLEDINYYLGVAEFKNGNWAPAAARMEDFLKALTHPSDFSPEANYILALSYMNQKQSDEALKVFQKILRLYPEDENVAKNSDIGIAKCQFELGQVKEAVKRFKLIVYKYPKTDVEQEALLWLAQYDMKNSQYDQAVDYYGQLLERFPDNAQIDQVHYELGQAYEVQGALDQALVQYRAVTSKDAVLFSKVKLAIAGIFSKEFDPQKAMSAYQNIVATNPEYARDAYLKMAQLYRNSQSYDKEIETYQKAMKIEQARAGVSNAELVFNIADAYEAMNRLGEAVDYYLKLPAQYPDQKTWVVKAYLRVAKIFEDRKDWEGAKVTYQKIIQLKTDESKYAQERLDWIKKK